MSEHAQMSDPPEPRQVLQIGRAALVKLTDTRGRVIYLNTDLIEAVYTSSREGRTYGSSIFMTGGETEIEVRESPGEVYGRVSAAQRRV